MERLQTELAHMLRLLNSATSFQAWRPYLWDKAKRLAETDPKEFEELPALLAAAVSALPPSIRSNSTPRKQPSGETAGETPAAGRT